MFCKLILLWLLKNKWWITFNSSSILYLLDSISSSNSATAEFKSREFRFAEFTFLVPIQRFYAELNSAADPAGGIRVNYGFNVVDLQLGGPQKAEWSGFQGMIRGVLLKKKINFGSCHQKFTLYLTETTKILMKPAFKVEKPDYASGFLILVLEVHLFSNLSQKTSKERSGIS